MARTYGSFSQITAPKVYKTALRLFAQYGYAAVSMRQIARDVGVQAGALYHYTPDKQTLLFTIMRDHMESLLCAWDACPKSDDPVVQLKEFIQFHLTFHLHKTDEVFVAYMELRNLTDENFSVIEELRRRYELVLEQILVRGAKAGVFHIT
ncbi:MAG: TetR/AcrR family transcriptional regulator, partial [Rhodobacteraceae bacterium]|nr:TetR/AcrR family transcriptional regulator [Paracoccaceae bacterium]